MSKTHQLNTKLIHAGEPQKKYGGAVSMPIFQSATFEFGGQTDYHELQYIRLSNTPNHIALHEKLAVLEGAEMLWSHLAGWQQFLLRFWLS